MTMSAADESAKILERLHKLGSFIGWDKKTRLTIEAIKPYCVPGNAAQAKGRMAIWVRSRKASKPAIIFPELVLLAMRFIAKPATRGRYTSLHPMSLLNSVSDSRSPARKFPGLSTHAGIYLVLARKLLDLPDNYQDPTTMQARAASKARKKNLRLSIRSVEGLLHETLIAFADALRWQDPQQTGRDWVDLTYQALRSRHGRASWVEDEPQHRAALASILDEINNDPGHADIRTIDIAVFAMLYLNALAEIKNLRASLITTVVNKLADAHDDGALEPVMSAISRNHDEAEQAFVEDFKRIWGMERH
jgi:hypothetical protein